MTNSGAQDAAASGGAADNSASKVRSGFSQLLHGYQERLEGLLDGYLEEQAQKSREVGAATREISEPLRKFVARGGKRLRPALVHFAYRAGGGEDDRSTPIEMAVELLHSYLLIHDDIMDRAKTRRGEPAVHKVFEALHAGRRWSGDSGRFGEAGAILLGDLAHSHAVSLFLSSADSARHRPAVSECFSEMCREVVIGQYLEMTAPFREDLGQDDLLTILRLKSGRYSVERPIQLGALLANAPDALIEGLSGWGLSVGEAFQLQDDLLGVFGEIQEVGKPVGGDLAEGKFTVLVQEAIDRVGVVEGDRILTCLRQEDPEESLVAEVREIVDSSGARAHVETMIADRLDRAARDLERLNLDDEAGLFFSGLIGYLRERRS